MNLVNTEGWILRARLLTVVALVAGCAGAAAPAPADGMQNCYVEPHDTSCAQWPVYCHAPQDAPDPTCHASDSTGEHFCCSFGTDGGVP